MPRPRAYVETTIPSFYFDQRRAPFMVARRLWTRAWWSVALERYELFTGPPVELELRRGPPARQGEWLALVEPLPVLDVTEAVAQAAMIYIKEKLMPEQGEDAMHLALASIHECQYLVTWDTRHLANAMKFNHIRKINQRLGLYVPTIATPLGLLGGIT